MSSCLNLFGCIAESVAVINQLKVRQPPRNQVVQSVDAVRRPQSLGFHRFGLKAGAAKLERVSQLREFHRFVLKR